MIVMKRIFIALLITLTQNGFSQDFCSLLSNAGIALTHDSVAYDPSYYSIGYPNGDVPADKGVCTDLIIRAYRRVGIDLQKEVHEDMKSNFNLYPTNWGLKQPDKNIDHRRVPNLMTFFERHGKSMQVSSKPKDYSPGDVVTWDLGGGVTHVGLVVDKKSADGTRNLIAHNIEYGQQLSDCLFSFRITGHYRYGR